MQLKLVRRYQFFVRSKISNRKILTMSKFTILVVVAALVCCINADQDPFSSMFDGLSSSFDDLGKMSSDFGKNLFGNLPSEDSIRNMAPSGPNEHKSGHFESHSNSVKYVNGKKVEDTGADHSLTNNDGHLSESSSQH